jgi:stearoyl-CoA desaturase (delta-9 desaturase)
MYQVFPDNEVQKGQLTMQLKRLRQTQEKLEWPSDSNDLPIISWESCMLLQRTGASNMLISRD